jgi:hypothetical protein
MQTIALDLVGPGGRDHKKHHSLFLFRGSGRNHSGPDIKPGV